jgi:hypothetical protein
MSKAGSYNKAVVDFGKGWKLVGIEQYPSHEAMIATGNTMEAYRALAAAGIHGYCRLCGHDVKDCYIVEKDGVRETVGSECIHKVMDNDRQGLQLQKAVKAVADKAKRDWERPYRQEQVAACYRENRAAIWATGWGESIQYRVNHDTNPDITAKGLKEIGIAFTWAPWTEEQKAARAAVVTAAIQAYISQVNKKGVK